LDAIAGKIIKFVSGVFLFFPSVTHALALARHEWQKPAIFMIKGRP